MHRFGTLKQVSASVSEGMHRHGFHAANYYFWESRTNLTYNIWQQKINLKPNLTLLPFI